MINCHYIYFYHHFNLVWKYYESKNKSLNNKSNKQKTSLFSFLFRTHNLVNTIASIIIYASNIIFIIVIFVTGIFPTQSFHCASYNFILSILSFTISRLLRYLKQLVMFIKFFQKQEKVTCNSMLTVDSLLYVTDLDRNFKAFSLFTVYIIFV